MAHDEKACRFCGIPRDRIIAENEYALAIEDSFPVSDGHSLVIPKRHALDYFELSTDELIACDALVKRLRQEILQRDPSVRGFNVGTNAGAVAGQTIFHCHIHLIPRREGDVANPQGGVRHVIPGKGHYKRAD